MTPVLVFDIETVPDIAAIRRLLALPAELPDADVAELAFQRRRTQSGSDFLPPHLQRIIVIGCVLREGDNVQVFSIGEPERDEPAIIQKFFDGIERYTPQLVSWNGTGFDLPVLNYRTLLCSGCAAKFWDQGEDDRDFKYNNYVNRYHARHLDLMDVLAMYQARNNVPLDEVARLAGFPGKLGMAGAAVWEHYRKGEIRRIRDYCETDCANTYLLYLRFQLQRGALTKEHYLQECNLLKAYLEKQNLPHWREFLSLWKT
jgi:predicted PolB exonuclease-like 3'-5' exonuclease